MKSSHNPHELLGSGPKHVSFRCYVANPKPSEAPEGTAGECDDEQRKNGMSRNIAVARLFLLVIACLFQSVAAAAQATQSPPPAASPTGHWVAEHASRGGIGSWWDFRPDGTLTLHFGAMVTTAIKRSGDTLTMPSGTVGGAPVDVTFRVDGSTLRLSNSDGQVLSYTRVGEAPLPSDPLLGKWRPVPPKTPAADPKMAALETANANALYVFAADGTESVRIPFGSREGTWDGATHTFKFPNESVVYSFQLSGAKLVLGQPPDGKKTDTYLPDPIF